MGPPNGRAPRLRISICTKWLQAFSIPHSLYLADTQLSLRSQFSSWPLFGTIDCSSVETVYNFAVPSKQHMQDIQRLQSLDTYLTCFVRVIRGVKWR